MPWAVRHARTSQQSVSKSRLDFSVMRGTFSFSGVFICILSGITTGMLSNTPGCGNKSSSCSGYCDICGPADRQFCYEILHKLQCHTKFVETIEGFNDTALCKRDVVLKPYNNFSACSEEIADCLLIPWPNPMVEDVFVEIHTKYFQDCPLQELRDPPPGIVFALVMTPICLIPAMVFLVVLKTKNGDGMS
ncbi:receptor activity-modifying protein 2 isoform X2 [Engraulis encrasicolus]|uniref:receptor activity-modifying protein 2 isoform X2 n=1 Tax=Engraulis encrasicolus TaxID=184585 RepID=UPI002FD37815